MSSTRKTADGRCVTELNLANKYDRWSHILQLLDGAEVFQGSRFGGGTGPIFLNHLDCSGTESSLIDCNQFAGDSCNHAQDAGVRCIGKEITCTNLS